MPAFDPNEYGPVALGLLTAERLPALGPGSPNRAAHSALQSLSVETLFPGAITDHDMARACISGLWLLHDFLDESHSISQEIDTPTGSYWHGIMHRREPDASNAKYWFRRIGSHPVVEALAFQTTAVGYRYQSPFAFVDFCERVRGSGSDDEMIARRVQLLEWQLLFDWCYRQTIDNSYG
jgi:hypothetical protein